MITHQPCPVCGWARPRRRWIPAAVDLYLFERSWVRHLTAPAHRSAMYRQLINQGQHLQERRHL